MQEGVQEVSFSPDDINTIHVILQSEILKLGDTVDWFTKNNVDFPDKKAYTDRIEHLLSMCNSFTCLLMEGAGVNGSKYVLRHVRESDS